MSELNILEQATIRDIRDPMFPELFPYENSPIYAKDGTYHQKWRKMRVYCNVNIIELTLPQMYQVIPFETLFGHEFTEKCVTYQVVINAPQPESIETLAEQTLSCFVVGGLIKLNRGTEYHKVKFEMSGASLASLLKNVVVKEEQRTSSAFKMFINLTQHPFSDEQREDIESNGIYTMTVDDKTRALLHFEELPTKESLEQRADEIISRLGGWNPTFTRYALIDGAPFFMSVLERKLKSIGIVPVYSFSKPVSTSVSKHMGWIEM